MSDIAQTEQDEHAEQAEQHHADEREHPEASGAAVNGHCGILA